MPLATVWIPLYRHDISHTTHRPRDMNLLSQLLSHFVCVCVCVWERERDREREREGERERERESERE